jgi:hypothetical protein
MPIFGQEVDQDDVQVESKFQGKKFTQKSVRSNTF